MGGPGAQCEDSAAEAWARGPVTHAQGPLGSSRWEGLYLGFLKPRGRGWQPFLGSWLPLRRSQALSGRLRAPAPPSGKGRSAGVAARVTAGVAMYETHTLLGQGFLLPLRQGSQGATLGVGPGATKKRACVLVTALDIGPCVPICKTCRAPTSGLRCEWQMAPTGCCLPHHSTEWWEATVQSGDQGPGRHRKSVLGKGWL